MLATMYAPDGWDLLREPLPGDRLGELHWPSHTIIVDPRIPAAAQRCTLAHETIHAERGPLPARPLASDPNHEGDP